MDQKQRAILALLAMLAVLTVLANGLRAIRALCDADGWLSCCP